LLRNATNSINMSTKGLSTEKVIVAVVIIMAFLGIGLYAQTQLLTKTNDQLPVIVCKNSVIHFVTQREIWRKVGQELEYTDLKCFTINREIKAYKDEEIKREVANALIECWDMYGQSQNPPLEVFNTEDRNFCAICHRLEFKEHKQVQGFAQFLITQNMPGKKVTYYEYLSGIQFDENMVGQYENSELARWDILDTSEPLAVILLMSKNAYPGGLVSTTNEQAAFYGAGTGGLAGGAITVYSGVGLCLTGIGCPVGMAIVGVGAAAGGIIGYFIGADRSADWGAHVVLGEYNHLSQELPCDYLEGRLTSPLEE